MKGLVRGGILASILSLAAAIFIYAQTTTENDLVIADGTSAQAVAQNNTEDNFLVSAFNTNSNTNTNSAAAAPVGDTKDEKGTDSKLIKKTVMSSAVGAGASKGSFNASAYCFTGRTATGQGVRRGLIAADPRVLPLGSKVYIEAGAWSGIYTVADTGGAIKGKRLDIWVPGCGEARKFGRRSVQVFAVAKQ
jgi:3D (Asp-Asp-Asp) domain-containing protein